MIYTLLAGQGAEACESAGRSSCCSDKGDNTLYFQTVSQDLLRAPGPSTGTGTGTGHRRMWWLTEGLAPTTGRPTEVTLFPS